MKVFFVIPRQTTLFGDEMSIAGDPHIGIAYLIEVLKKHNIVAKRAHITMYMVPFCFYKSTKQSNSLLM